MANKNYLTNISTISLFGAVGVYTEYLQQKVQKQEMQWHPFLGQGSDLAAGAMYTALFLIAYHYIEQKHRTQLFDWTAPVAAGTLCTIGECTTIMGDTFDPKDIAAYWLGAGVAYAIHRIAVTESLEAKIAPKSL